MLNFMRDWFPEESKKKLKQNEREAAVEELEELEDLGQLGELQGPVNGPDHHPAQEKHPRRPREARCGKPWKTKGKALY